MKTPVWYRALLVTPIFIVGATVYFCGLTLIYLSAWATWFSKVKAEETVKEFLNAYMEE